MSVKFFSPLLQAVIYCGSCDAREKLLFCVCTCRGKNIIWILFDRYIWNGYEKEHKCSGVHFKEDVKCTETMCGRMDERWIKEKKNLYMSFWAYGWHACLHSRMFILSFSCFSVTFIELFSCSIYYKTLVRIWCQLLQTRFKF